MVHRRELLRTLARGAVYAAPVVVTLSTPLKLRAVITSGMIMLMSSAETAPAPELQSPGTRQAPWDGEAPWARPPSSTTPPDPGRGRE